MTHDPHIAQQAFDRQVYAVLPTAPSAMHADVVAGRLGVSHQKAAAALRRLCAAGLVDARPAPVIVRHTPAGAPVYRDKGGYFRVGDA